MIAEQKNVAFNGNQTSLEGETVSAEQKNIAFNGNQTNLEGETVIAEQKNVAFNGNQTSLEGETVSAEQKNVAFKASTENLNANQQAKPSEINPKDVVNSLKSQNPNEQSMALFATVMIAQEGGSNARKLVNKEVVNSLIEILHTDTSSLAGPTPAQIKVRKAVMEGKDVPADQLELAKVPSPMEIAEQNKQFALYSIAMIDGVMMKEIDKKNENSKDQKIEIAISDLPGIDAVVETAKSNKNPALRATALEALFYVAKPEFAPVLKPIFESSQNDDDINVSLVAREAASSLDNMLKEDSKANKK